MSADEQARVYDDARHRYEDALLNPSVELEDLLWLANLTLATCRDYLYALEAEVLASLPGWQRGLVRLAGTQRVLGAIVHYERTARLLREGVR